MAYVISNLPKNNEHKTTCSNCKSIIAFTNSDIISDDMGMCIVCPKCGKDIKF